ncbi:hypothetical protein CDL12_21051 [Handroanthus impetiginosus]|uniref:FAF domain-containing protein n=1 Tax=Handroanthus impetiginosus TaxID=429701 RepID=A0A2G9GMF6_9LAMI|nr:hypothetical protein CDL12_21051 [Handroanthus impetiginosus]
MISTKQSMSQGLQSCLEPHILKPSKSEQGENPCSKIETNCESNKNRWNFLEALTKTSPNFKQLDNNSKLVYVHPLLKRSSSSMSTQSLEMCTESLMSETGSNVFLTMDEFSYLISEKKNSSTTKQPESHVFSKKVKRSNTFPPPLTSRYGSNGVQMQAHREEGRLVIKALSSCRRSFEVERENGRLTLSLLKKDDHDNGEEVEGEKEDHFNGLRGEKVGCNIRGGEWGNSRCNGDGRLPRVPFCVAIS